MAHYSSKAGPDLSAEQPRFSAHPAHWDLPPLPGGRGRQRRRLKDRHSYAAVRIPNSPVSTKTFLIICFCCLFFLFFPPLHAVWKCFPPHAKADSIWDDTRTEVTFITICWVVLFSDRLSANSGGKAGVEHIYITSQSHRASVSCGPEVLYCFYNMVTRNEQDL